MILGGESINAAIQSNFHHVKKLPSFQSTALISPTRMDFGHATLPNEGTGATEGGHSSEFDEPGTMSPFSVEQAELQSMEHEDVVIGSGGEEHDYSHSATEDDHDDEDETGDSFTSPPLSTTQLHPALTPGAMPTSVKGYFSLSRSRSATLSSAATHHLHVHIPTTPTERHSSLPFPSAAATIRSRAVSKRPELFTSPANSSTGVSPTTSAEEAGSPTFPSPSHSQIVYTPAKRHSTSDAIFDSETPRTPLVPATQIQTVEGNDYFFGSVGRRRGQPALGLVPKR
ncbi:hypothetical protein BT69DRAFT_501615 [Atractiella rhizophila]|nr:hypothetical protein BT69DRAFT_501615 [Atractiella rhizophila]